MRWPHVWVCALTLYVLKVCSQCICSQAGALQERGAAVHTKARVRDDSAMLQPSDACKEYEVRFDCLGLLARIIDITYVTSSFVPF